MAIRRYSVVEVIIYMAWVPDAMRNQELEKVLEVRNKIEINW